MRWLTGAVNLAKSLAARLVFICALIVLLPLAVLNRQTVTLSLNPMDLTRAAAESVITVPLFIALFGAFSFGLLAGWLLGYLSKNKHRRTLPSGPGVIKTTQFASDENSMSGTAPAFKAAKALSDAPGTQAGEESEASHETRKSDAG